MDYIERAKTQAAEDTVRRALRDSDTKVLAQMDAIDLFVQRMKDAKTPEDRAYWAHFLVKAAKAEPVVLVRGKESIAIDYSLPTGYSPSND
ncbi:hypothetical protein [Nonomuraea rubra]|uniref:hypothetical protein n=1 Tax=Nonomuraea rubra TaxID=46180 RepID=UPI0033D364F8